MKYGAMAKMDIIRVHVSVMVYFALSMDVVIVFVQLKNVIKELDRTHRVKCSTISWLGRITLTMCTKTRRF